MGLVSEVYKTDELHSKVIDLANEMANKPITALKAAKKVIRDAENLGIKDGIALERK